MGGWLPWREATTAALYGPAGFYRRDEGPAGHFRTSVHVGNAFAAALATLADRLGVSTVVDVGAGRGELAGNMAVVAPHLDVVGVEIGDPGFPDDVPAGAHALLVANEWLDDVPVDVVESTPAGPRVVEVDQEGAQRLGPPPGADDLAWLHRWWPLREVGDRAEVGRPRDEAWAAVVARLASGVAVAIDYGHTVECRPPAGTLTGYRAGRQLAPVPDASMDITAHVAVDSCAATAAALPTVTTTALTTQRRALRALGVTGDRPPIALASSDPARYVDLLGTASVEAELLDPDGLGAFHWLLHGVGVALPDDLAAVG